jgi:hypothetical protein
MTFFAKKSRMCRWSLLAASLAVTPIFGSMNAARAASVSSGNSTLTINPTTSGPYISDWVVDGVDQYGGTPAGGDTLVVGGVPINNFSLTSSFFSSGIASATYTQGQLQINVKDVLTGGSAGSGASAINEIITFSDIDTDSQDEPLTFTFQDHVDYNVNATPNNDTLTLSPGTPNTATQTDPTGATINFTATPTPDSTELDNGGSNIGTLGPSTGNVAFGFYYSLSIDPNSSEQISFNETLTGPTSAAVPLPNSAYSALFMLAGLGAIGGYRKMRRTV